MGTIYGLKCPESGHFRYVGKTLGKLSRRLTRHIREARQDKSRYTHKERWIRKLDSLGLVNQIEIVEIEAVSDYVIAEREVYWISYYRQIYDLTNTSEGGEGNRLVGRNHPMYGKPMSEERKRQLSISRMGENNPMYGKKYIRTKEMREATSRGLRRSEAFQAKKADPEYRAKIKKTLAKPVYLVTLDGDIYKEYNSCRDIAKEFGVTYSAVKNARRFGATFDRKYKIVYVKDMCHEPVQVPSHAARDLES